MHYAFDLWMTRTYPVIRFERYADDVIIHVFRPEVRSFYNIEKMWQAPDIDATRH